MDDLGRLEALVAIMDRLRDPGGCPWDREQDSESLRGYLIEECHEVAEAIDRGDPQALQEELGDLLFQIVFLARLAKEQRSFTLEDVIRGIAHKMIRRHPHIFGDAEAATAEDVMRNWEEIKRREKRPAGGEPGGEATSILDGLPAGLPPLLKARRLGERAAGVGFDWKDAEHVLQKLDEEVAELKRAVTVDRDTAREELGDLLFTTVMLARRLRLDPELALERANRKFARRFAWMEQELARSGTALEHAGPELLERLWDRAKRQVT
jgi:MazG family protein